jgi:hypothetical protein
VYLVNPDEALRLCVPSPSMANEARRDVLKTVSEISISAICSERKQMPRA